MGFVKGKTPMGYKYSIDEGAFTDFNFLRALNDADSKDVNKRLDGMIKMISVLFNDEEKEKDFYEFLTAKHGGRLPLEVISSEVRSILLKVNESREDVKK